jgi:Co/Zn/Cd efflux system component
MGASKSRTTASLGALSVAAIVSDVVGGVASNSLALQIGAAHLAVGLYVQAAPYLSNIGGINPSDRLLHGLVLFCATLLSAGVFFVIFTGGHRILHVERVDGTLIAFSSVVGISSTLVVAFLGTSSMSSPVEWNRFWSTIFDPLAAIALLAVGVGIELTGQFWLDSIAALGLLLLLFVRFVSIQFT